MPAEAPPTFRGFALKDRTLSPLVDGQVAVAGESINALLRVYNAEPEIGPIASWSIEQGLIRACIYTRHCDGFVRQRYVEALLARSEPWIPAFILQLLGEYVIEIAQVIYRGLDVIPRDQYHSFAGANPAFIARICQQIVSYYHWISPSTSGGPFWTAPSYAVMNELGLWDRRVGARLLRHRT
jgi:hypothetical protein